MEALLKEWAIRIRGDEENGYFDETKEQLIDRIKPSGLVVVFPKENELQLDL